MILKIFVALGTFVGSTLAFGASPNLPELNAELSKAKEVVAKRYSLPKGNWVLDFKLKKPAKMPTLSIWYDIERSCRDFFVYGSMQFQDAKGKWHKSKNDMRIGRVNKYGKSIRSYKAIRIYVQSNRKNTCTFRIKGENVYLEKTVIKVTGATCQGENQNRKCTYKAVTKKKKNFLIDDATGKAHKLKVDSVYKVEGYSKYVKKQRFLFITTSTKVK